MIDFLMSILSTPFCVHADKTSNFVDLFTLRIFTSSLRTAASNRITTVASSSGCLFTRSQAGVEGRRGGDVLPVILGGISLLVPTEGPINERKHKSLEKLHL